MFKPNFYAIICALCSMQFFGINAYPTINMQRLFGSDVETGRYKKSVSDLRLPQTDSDVLELEHLKNDKNNEDSDIILGGQKFHHHLQQDLMKTPAVTQTDFLLPDLEHELESAAETIRTITVAPILTMVAPGTETIGQREHEQDKIGHDGDGQHRPPMLPHNDGGKISAGNQHHEILASAANSPAAPSLTKPFYGAARLAFGQNPEVLPTSSSTTTSTTTTTIASISHTTLINDGPSDASIPAEIEANTTSSNSSTTLAISPSAAAATSELSHGNSFQLNPLGTYNLDQAEVTMQGLSKNTDSDTKERVVSDDDVTDKFKTLKSSTARRSVTLMPPKIADSLLRHRDGQYSSFDMAQYIFWTGDEAGVARAVEEFIEQGLMTRENALKFLRDIRLGIEYLQRSYSNRVFPEEMRQNSVKKSYPAQPLTLQITTTTTTTEKPFPYVHLEQTSGQGITSFGKSLDSISMWNKLQELNNDERQDLSDYDETAGRAKIAEFLYTEYTLEEMLYKLAKVMFTQSLAHGSDEAQQELQKLTDFLEREGNLGVIPIDLQKKVLHVLLRALSDTLSERPELLPAARLNLANPYNRLPLHTSY